MAEDDPGCVKMFLHSLDPEPTGAQASSCKRQSHNPWPQPYSITSSTSASTFAGKSKPIALAVLRLRMNGYLTGRAQCLIVHRARLPKPSGSTQKSGVLATGTP